MSAVPLRPGDVVACTVLTQMGVDRWLGAVAREPDAEGFVTITFGDERQVRVVPPGAVALVYRKPPPVVQMCRLPYALAGTVTRSPGGLVLPGRAG